MSIVRITSAIVVATLAITTEVRSRAAEVCLAPAPVDPANVCHNQYAAEQRLSVARDHILPNRLLLTLNAPSLAGKSRSIESVRTLLKTRYGISRVAQIATMPRVLVAETDEFDLVQTASLMQALERAESDGESLFSCVDPDVEFSVASVPNDPKFVCVDSGGCSPPAQWGLGQIEAPAAWDLRRCDGPEVTVAIADSGLAKNVAGTKFHPDLEAQLWSNSDPLWDTTAGADGVVGDLHGANFVEQPATGHIADDEGHGTHVAGIIAASTNNSVGVAGTVGPYSNVRLMILKVLTTSANGRASGSSSAAIAAIGYAKANHASIINMSFGSCHFSCSVCSAIREAGEAGILVIAAAGQHAGQNAETYPTYPGGYALDNIVAVMSTNSLDGPGTLTDGGEVSIDLGAPGDAITSTVLFDDYGQDTGTSMAAGFVSGAAALVRAYNPTWGPSLVREHLIDTVYIPSTSLASVSKGRLDLKKALSAPIAFSVEQFPLEWTAGSPVTVTWEELVKTRGCPTVSLSLVTDEWGIIPLASQVRAASESVEFNAPGTTITGGRLQIVCDGSRFMDERGPITVAGQT